MFVDTSLLEIEARRAANDRNPVRQPIRDAVFQQHLQHFQFPSDDETVVRISNDGDVAQLLSRQRGDQL